MKTTDFVEFIEFEKRLIYYNNTKFLAKQFKEKLK